MKKSDLESIKKAILPSMAELFEVHAENTKKLFETHSRETKVQFERMNKEIDRHVHETKILLEQMDGKIDVAIEFAQKAMENTSVTDPGPKIRTL